jgi:hypothetical protein
VCVRASSGSFDEGWNEGHFLKCPNTERSKERQPVVVVVAVVVVDVVVVVP